MGLEYRYERGRVTLDLMRADEAEGSILLVFDFFDGRAPYGEPMFWKENSRGYTDDYRMAGRYASGKAKGIISGSPDRDIWLVDPLAVQPDVVFRSSLDWALVTGVDLLGTGLGNARVRVMDPDGWDRGRFDDSVLEQITREEFDRRVSMSTCVFAQMPPKFREGDRVLFYPIRHEDGSHPPDVPPEPTVIERVDGHLHYFRRGPGPREGMIGCTTEHFLDLVSQEGRKDG